MKFNINDVVTVSLTDLGKKVMVRYYAKRDQRPPDKEWVDGKFQLWYLIEIFGPYINGAMQDPYFKGNIIEIEDKNGSATNSQ